MNSAEHAVAGGVASVAAYLALNSVFEREVNLTEALFALGAGVAIGLLPDILEPATSSYHRGFFHSFTFAALISYLLYRLYKNGSIENELKILAGVLSSAYGSHLALDLTTPRGLPL